MSVYDPLLRELGRTRAQTIRLTFSEIEEILGRPLPPSAYKFSAWWGNESSRKAGHTQAMAWLQAGFTARVSLKQGRWNSIEHEGFHGRHLTFCELSRASGHCYSTETQFEGDGLI
jgi:hypothetical protein